MAKTWRSQPKLKGNNAGDIAVSAALILSGNNYAKIRMMFRFMNMGMCHLALHSYSQRTYTFPAIEEHWRQLQAELLLSRKGKEVVISGKWQHELSISALYTIYFNISDIQNVYKENCLCPITGPKFQCLCILFSNR